MLLLKESLTYKMPAEKLKYILLMCRGKRVNFFQKSYSFYIECAFGVTMSPPLNKYMGVFRGDIENI